MEKVLMSPILLSPGDRLVTVFGGGKVALRKCRHFEGFRIRVVSPEVLPELEAIAHEVIREAVDPETAGGYMEGSDIVVAATHDHALNDAIRDVSMSKGIMTNSAHGGGDVLIPGCPDPINTAPRRVHRDGVLRGARPGVPAVRHREDRRVPGPVLRRHAGAAGGAEEGHPRQDTHPARQGGMLRDGDTEGAYRRALAEGGLS